MSALNIDIQLLTDYLNLQNERPLFMPMWEPSLVPAANLRQQKNGNRRLLACDVEPSGLIENAELIYGNLASLKGDFPFAFHAGGGNQWLEAICGCEIYVSGGSIWAKPPPDDSLQKFLERDVDAEWIKTLNECHYEMVKWAEGKAFCALPVIHGPLDILVAHVGVMEISYAMYEEPDLLMCALNKATDICVDITHNLASMLKPESGGYASRMHIYTPKPCTTVQNDASYMMSPENFKKYLEPLEKRIVSCVPNSVYHMHNTSLHNLETIASLGCCAVQISVDPNGPHINEQIKIYEEIKKRVPLVLSCWTLETLEYLNNSLTPSGLALTLTPSPEHTQLDENGRYAGFDEWNYAYSTLTSRYF